MIYFTADTHFGHDKEFLYRSRGFDSVEEMDSEIIRRWNSVVNKDDTVYILGDVMLNDNDNGMDILSMLNGNIKIILGNHDTETRQKLYKEAGYECSWAEVIKYGKRFFYLSHFPMLTGNSHTDPRENRHYNLHGHTHQKTNFSEELSDRNYHVGLDSHDCYPVSFERVIIGIEKKIKYREGFNS